MNERVRRYYMCMLGMAGELISKNAPRRAPFPQSSAGDELRRMIAARLIRYYKHEDGKRTFRVSDPNGFSVMSEIDPRLKEHAELFIGRRGARYPGSKEYRKKKRKEAMLVYAMLENGVVVDGCEMAEDEHMFLSPTLISPDAIIKSCPKEKPLFLSGPVLKKARPGSEHTRREMSVSSGAMIGPAGTIPVYLLGTPNFRWYAASETQTAIDIRRMYEDAAGLPRSRDRRLKAFILADDINTITGIASMCGRSGYKMDPTTIFKLCYIAPMENEQHAIDIAKMLMVPNWKNKVNDILGIKSINTDSCDGIADDGKKIYNLLCFNLGRMKDAERDVKKHRCRLIIHDWQRPVLEKVYGEEIDAVELSPAHFKGLLITIAKMRN